MTMIKINLLPPAFSVAKKKKTKAKAGAPSKSSGALEALPWKMIGLGAGILFLITTLYFDFDYVKVSKKMKSLSVELAVAQPVLKALKDLEGEVSGTLVPERDFLMTHVLNKAPITTVLQKMSEALPDGVWLQSFKINNSGKSRSFLVKGLAVNIEGKTNIQQIEEFLQKLKEVIPTAQFTYSTSKQVFKKAPVTAFNAEYKWQAD